MSENLKIWWRGRTLREQRLLLAMFGLVAVVLGWLLVVRPLGAALEEAKLRHNSAVVALAEAHAEADAIEGLETVQAPPAALPVDSLISSSASETGFTDARITTHSPDRATIAITAARPQAFFAWVSRMEGQGLIVEALRAQANSDQTIAAEATFRARSG